MRINSDQLFRQLPKQLMPLYTITGDELLLALEAADAIRHQARQHGYTERDIFTADHRFDWSKIQCWQSQSSLFGERRILDLRIPTGKPGKEGGNAIEALCQNPSADTITLIMLPKIDKQTQTSKWFKALDHSSVMVTVDPIEHARLANWIQQRLDSQGQQIAPDSLQFLANKVEGNLLAAQQEIKKLALLYPSGMLSFEQVKNAVLNVARYDVFSLPEAMLTADTVRYTRILEGLQGEGTPPPLILSTLTEPIRTLLLIHQALAAGKPLAQTLKDSRVWHQQQKIMTAAVKRLPPRLLLQALLHAASIDKIIKGVAQGDIWDELLQFGLRLTTRQTSMH